MSEKLGAPLAPDDHVRIVMAISGAEFQDPQGLRIPRVFWG